MFVVGMKNIFQNQMDLNQKDFLMKMGLFVFFFFKLDKKILILFLKDQNLFIFPI